jgi:DNA-binding PadR family transcriptional regulator
VLKDAGLVTDRAEGTRRVYQVDAEGLAALREYFDGFWTEALDAFKHVVEETHAREKKTKRKKKESRR